MIVIPAIDIISGQCVRLYKGDYGIKTVYDSDPVKTALKWQSAGAKWVHLIDLDGAKSGNPLNLPVAIKIKESSGLKIEYGGGIRDIDTVKKCISAGIDKIILGTAALKNMDFFSKAYEESGGKAIISLDFSDKGIILTDGWTKNTGILLEDIALELKSRGCSEAIVTDVSKDGTLEGVDILRIKNFISNTGLKIFVAGGVTNLIDILKLKEIENTGIKGVIIGKALYEKTIDLFAAIQAAEGGIN